MKIISIVSPKGGTGTRAPAAAMAGRVWTVLLDLDPHATAARWFHIWCLPEVTAGPFGIQELLRRRSAAGRFAATLLVNAENAALPVDRAFCDTAGGACRPTAEAAAVSDPATLPRLTDHVRAQPTSPARSSDARDAGGGFRERSEDNVNAVGCPAGCLRGRAGAAEDGIPAAAPPECPSGFPDLGDQYVANGETTCLRRTRNFAAAAGLKPLPDETEQRMRP